MDSKNILTQTLEKVYSSCLGGFRKRGKSRGILAFLFLGRSGGIG